MSSSSSRDKVIASSCDVKNLPSVFHDDPGEEDFYGFTGPNELQNVPSSDEATKQIDEGIVKHAKRSKDKK